MPLKTGGDRLKLSAILISVFLAAAIVPITAGAATVTIRPDSQGYYSGWSNTGCSSGSSEWQCVDETPADTSDYLRTSSSNTRETFGFQGTGLYGDTINSVTLYYYAKRYGTSKYKIQPLIRSGGTNYAGNIFSTTADYAYYSQEYDTNPATGLAWTVAQVDGLEAGMVSYSSNPGAYVAQVYAVVDYSIPDSCSDSDGGNSPFVQGVTYGYLNQSYYNSTDYCVDSGTVKEYYCIGAYEHSTQQNCGTDYYGMNYCVNSSVYRDFIDYYCSSGACGFSVTPEFVESCAYGCLNGTCQSPPNSCSDTDGGFVVGAFGTVSGYYFGSPYSYSDACVDNWTLSEWECAGGYAYNFANYSCSWSNYTMCMNGACV
jgi:hypothetical protein